MNHTSRNILWIVMVVLPLFSCGDKPEKTFHENGNVMEEYRVTKDGKKNGKYVSYYDNGITYEISEYNNDVLVGVRKLHFPDGKIEISETYNDSGELHGPYLTYYKNGQIMTEKTYDRNVLTGEVKVYYENGRVKEVVQFVNNQENGPFTEYFPNGKIQWKGTYLNGPNEFGPLEEYDSTGILIKKMMCDSFAICRSTWKIENYDEKYKD
jgi:antitoxin component YwqK of YwqJK toxin-antitoxin module